MEGEMKWYDRTWVVVLLLVLFFPVGYYALYKNRSMGRTGKLVLGGAFVVLIFIAVGQGEVGSDSASRENVTATEQAAPEEGSAESEDASEQSGRVTMAKFQQIETGMSYSEVRSIIGKEGEEMSRNSIGGTETVMYKWSNPGGSNMNAMFQDGELIQKSQFGLK